MKYDNSEARAARIENNKALRQIATHRLGVILPPYWRMQKPEVAHSLCFEFKSEKDNRQVINVTISDDGNKLIFSANWAEDVEGEEHCPPQQVIVGVSLNKTNAKIIDDLRRRFWSVYELQWKESVRLAEVENRLIVERKDALNRLANAMNYNLDPRETQEQKFHSPDGLVVINDQAMVRITTEYLPVKAAIEVAVLIRAMKGK